MWTETTVVGYVIHDFLVGVCLESGFSGFCFVLLFLFRFVFYERPQYTDSVGFSSR